MNLPETEFPRPDRKRELWQSLNGEWAFSFDEPNFDKIITVPFCYQAKASGINIQERHDVVWYQRAFTVETDLMISRRVMLNFGAVDYKAKVWINDIYVGTHSGGHTPFVFDITKELVEGENKLTVKVEDYSEMDKPRGKQTWTGENFWCWYTPTTGIWQNVWLEYVGRIYLEEIKITPNLENLQAKCEIFLSSKEETNVLIDAVAEFEGRPMHLCGLNLICENGYGVGYIAFPEIDFRHDQFYWTPENPKLIEVKIAIKNEGADDIVHSYFGFRSIEIEGNKILLNGKEYFQRLVLDQGYWEDTMLTPPSDEALRKDIELVKAMGFNGVRKHQKIEDPRFYYWADKLGLLVWGELPSAYTFNDNAIISSLEEMTAFIKRDYNHPSIVAWIPVNESWGVHGVYLDKRKQSYVKALYYWIKALDPYRISSTNDGWELTEDTDICTIHDYALFQDTIDKYGDMEALLADKAEHTNIFAKGHKYKGQPIIISEYGGVSFNNDGGGYYDPVADEEAFLSRIKPVTDFLKESGKFAGYCYTQLTDVMQEKNGLLNAIREPKLSIEQLKKVFG